MRTHGGELSTRFDEALAFASSLRRGQMRKGTSIPFIAHLLGVCDLVLTDGGDEAEAIAALLHDALEEHGDKVTGLDIEARFGSRVRQIVEACTDKPESYRGGPKPEWGIRKRAYVAHLAHTPPNDGCAC
jgi:(p)ppGpp synthase/HD superfamily hydrolase